MAYTPNPFETTQPTTDKFVETAAAEFRALKSVVNNLYATSNYVGDWASLTGALAAGKTVTHAGTVWFLLTALANVTTSEPGVSADWLDLGNVKRSGDIMTGPLSVPAGATGSQVPRRSEVVGLSGDESIGGVKTFTSKPKVPAGATGDEVPQAQEIFGKSQSWQPVTRTSGVTYTNTTGKPIVFIGTGSTSAVTGFMSLAVDSTVVALSSYASASPANVGVTAVIPAGSTYVLSWSNVTSTSAKEYR